MFIKKIIIRKIAFTLAEVLIVLGIIGIIAQMTIPPLVQSTLESKTISSTKKIYSVLSSAYLSATDKYGEPRIWTTSSGGTGTGAVNFFNNMKEFLSVSNDCGASSGLGCFHKGVTYKVIDNGSWTILDNYTSASKVRLADGMSIFFYLETNQCTTIRGSSQALNAVCGYAMVDINGDKAPDVVGKDVFGFWITNYGIVPRGTSLETTYTFSDYCVDANGSSCAAWILYNNNMDYLKSCKSSLDWNASSSCN